MMDDHEYERQILAMLVYERNRLFTAPHLKVLLVWQEKGKFRSALYEHLLRARRACRRTYMRARVYDLCTGEVLWWHQAPEIADPIPAPAPEQTLF